MPLHFFIFVSERAPKSPSSSAIAAWQCHYSWEARAPPGRTSGHAAHEEHDVCMNMNKAATHSAPSFLPAHPRCRCSARCERVLHGMYARALNDNMPRKEHLSRHHRKRMQTKKRERWVLVTRETEHPRCVREQAYHSACCTVAVASRSQNTWRVRPCSKEKSTDPVVQSILITHAG